MGTISSLILNSDQAENSPTPETNETNFAAINETEPTLVDAASQDLLAEIQAIKDAIVNNEDFDFTTLEATAAGLANSSISDEKSASSSPILLTEDNLLIQYRGNNESTLSSTPPNQNNDSDRINDDDNTDSIFTDTLSTPVSEFQANLSEDIITQTRGTFDNETDISAQTINTQYGQLITHDDGSWDYALNNQHDDVQALSSGSTLQDTINLTTNSGSQVQLSITINGSNDQAIITGQKQADIDALPLSETAESQPSVSGKLNVSDIDTGEARFDTNFDIKGSFGTAQINALGEWSYTLNNTSEAVLGLHAGEKIFDLFSVKTLDGSKQLIQISIQGANDKPLLSGKNSALLDLETDMTTQGSLTVNDPDFGESAFQAFSNIQSSLGYGSAEIDSQGNWTFNLNSEFASLNPLDEGMTRIDSFDVFTIDGTSQTINVPIIGSDTPFFADVNTSANQAESLAVNEVLSDEETQQDNDSLSTLFNEQHDQTSTLAASQNTGDNNQQIEASIYMNGDTANIGSPLNQSLNDIPIS